MAFKYHSAKSTQRHKCFAAASSHQSVERLLQSTIIVYDAGNPGHAETDACESKHNEHPLLRLSRESPQVEAGSD